MIPDEIPQPREAVFGDNSGSMLVVAREEQAAALRDTVRDGGRTFDQRRSEFLASAAAQRVVDRQTAADAADTIKMAGEVWAMIDADRRTRSDPFRETHLALSAAASEFWEPVNEAMAGLRGQIDGWTAEEDKRIADREREQREEMARWRGETPAAPPPAATTGRAAIDYTAPSTPTPAVTPVAARKRAKIRGDLGSTISARETVEYEIEDISLIPDHIMQSPTVVAAILAVVKATARHMGVPKGIRTVTNTGNQIR